MLSKSCICPKESIPSFRKGGGGSHYDQFIVYADLQLYLFWRKHRETMNIVHVHQPAINGPDLSQEVTDISSCLKRRSFIHSKPGWQSLIVLSLATWTIVASYISNIRANVKEYICTCKQCKTLDKKHIES